MRRTLSLTGWIAVGIAAASLTGCGNSTPIPAASSSAPPSSYTASAGAFAAIPASDLQQAAAAVASCNLDAINDQSANGQTLAAGSDALFAGWAGDGDNQTVPADVQLILSGAKDYAVSAATGQPRPDVASATKTAAFANAGYQVKASLAQVGAGSYHVLLQYHAGAKLLRCKTAVELTVG